MEKERLPTSAFLIVPSKAVCRLYPFGSPCLRSLRHDRHGEVGAESYNPTRLCMTFLVMTVPSLITIRFMHIPGAGITMRLPERV